MLRSPAGAPEFSPRFQPWDCVQLPKQPRGGAGSHLQRYRSLNSISFFFNRDTNSSSKETRRQFLRIGDVAPHGGKIRMTDTKREDATYVSEEAVTED